jgi:glutamyl/glutaminyl-tRNA synthetase
LREDKTKKLGKRDGAKDVLEYRTEGYLPEAMINFLALIGWNPGGEKEIFSREELLAAFDISGIHSHGGVFNEEKLRWVQKEHLSHLSDAAFLEYIRPAIPTSVPAVRIERIVPVLRERTILVSEVQDTWAGEYAWVDTAPTVAFETLVWKDTSPEDTGAHLAHARTVLETLDDASFADSALLKNALWDYATEKGRGNVLWPLRVCLTGLERSPDPFVVASILGKTETLARIDAALATRV